MQIGRALVDKEEIEIFGNARTLVVFHDSHLDSTGFWLISQFPARNSRSNYHTQRGASHWTGNMKSEVPLSEKKYRCQSTTNSS
jgi:hypothetical protein